MNNSFIGYDKITKATLIGIVLWFLSFYLILCLWFLFVIFIIFLFRKKRFDLNRKRILEPNIINSPVSGVVSHISTSEEKVEIVIRSSPFNHYGVYLPISSLVESRKIDKNEIEIILVADTQKISLKHTSLLNSFKGVLYVNSGDRGMLGANIGYLPFGGKTVIELPKRSVILIKEGDKVESFQTLLSKIPLEK